METNLLESLSSWLSHTPLSLAMQGAMWIIPTIQTVHILSIAVIISSMFLVDLRLIGLFARSEPLMVITDRFLPWAWGSLVPLAVTGSLLVVAEPKRSLTSTAFGLKLIMLSAALVIVALLQGGLRRSPAYWENSSATRLMSRIAAVLSLALWIGVVLAGRFIAYLAVA